MYTTISIISLSIIYFICYLIEKAKEEANQCTYFIKQISFYIIGYLVQFNLTSLNIFENIDGSIKVNTRLLVLKIFMILETLKRIYFYVIRILF